MVLERLYRLAGEPLVFFGVASALLGVGVWSTSASPTVSQRPWFMTAVPGAFHGLMVVLLVFAGIGTAEPALYLVFLLSTLTSMTAFRGPTP